MKGISLRPPKMNEFVPVRSFVHAHRSCFDAVAQVACHTDHYTVVLGTAPLLALGAVYLDNSRCSASDAVARVRDSFQRQILLVHCSAAVEALHCVVVEPLDPVRAT